MASSRAGEQSAAAPASVSAGAPADVTRGTVPDEVIAELVLGSKAKDTTAATSVRSPVAPPALAGPTTDTRVHQPVAADSAATSSTLSGAVRPATAFAEPVVAPVTINASVLASQRAAVEPPAPKRDSVDQPAGQSAEPLQSASSTSATAVIPPAKMQPDAGSNQDLPAGVPKRAASPERVREATPSRAGNVAPVPPVPPQGNTSAEPVAAAAPLKPHQVSSEPAPVQVSPDRVTLRLPDSDGNTTTVRIAVRGDQVRTTFVTSDAGMSQQLSAQAPELERALAGHGFREAAVMVSTDSGPARSTDNQGPLVAAPLGSGGGESMRGSSRQADGSAGEPHQGRTERDHESPDRKAEDQPRQGRSHQRARQGRAR